MSRGGRVIREGVGWEEVMGRWWGCCCSCSGPRKILDLGFITRSRGGGCAGYDRALPSPRKSSTDASDLARYARIT